MSFFFFTGKSAGKRSSISTETLRSLRCKACPLDRSPGLKSPKMRATGSSEPDIYILGEAPGRLEDEEGFQFIGPSGEILRRAIGRDAIKRCRFQNTLRCRPPKNRDPESIETECCRPWIEEDIAKSKPRAIFGFGNFPLVWATGQSGIKAWRGKHIPVTIGGHSCWFFPFVHPAAMLHKRDPEELRQFQSDVRKAIAALPNLTDPTPILISDLREQVKSRLVVASSDHHLRSVRKALTRLLDSPGPIGFDIETASNEKIKWRKLRPYGQAARLLTIAFSAESADVAIALDHHQATWSPEGRAKVRSMITDFLAQTKVRRGFRMIAHNLRFELEWLSYHWGTDLLDIARYEDSLGQAYVLGGRQGSLSLDALSMAYFGFDAKAVVPVDVNALDSEPLDDVLRYNAIDARVCRMLYETQTKELDRLGMKRVYREQARRIPTTVLTQLRGLKVSAKEVERHSEDLAKKVAKAEARILGMSCCRKFETRFKQKFNPQSPAAVLLMFRDVLHLNVESKGKESTDEDVLAELDHPLAPAILELRGLIKLKSTYVDSLHPRTGHYVWPDGLMHPQLNTARTHTRRTSSEQPNEQNYPKRENREIRSQIVAGKDHVMCPHDYGQIEYRVFGMTTKDKTIIRSLAERYDIHREWGIRIGTEYPALIGGRRFLSDPQVMKDLRQDAKNKFVFPSFYGARSSSIARNLGVPEGIMNRLHAEFWRQFSGVREWQDAMMRFYQKNGYVELLTGFRCPGPLSPNQVMNYPIQGTASDIVVDAMNRLSERARATGDHYIQPVLNVHDDLTGVFPESKANQYIEIYVQTMLDCPFEFVNVPLAVEVSTGPDWFHQTELGSFFSDIDLPKGVRA